MIKSIYSIQ